MCFFKEEPTPCSTSEILLLFSVRTVDIFLFSATLELFILILWKTSNVPLAISELLSLTMCIRSSTLSLSIRIDCNSSICSVFRIYNTSHWIKWCDDENIRSVSNNSHFWMNTVQIWPDLRCDQLFPRRDVSNPLNVFGIWLLSRLRSFLCHNMSSMISPTYCQHLFENSILIVAEKTHTVHHWSVSWTDFVVWNLSQ